MGSDIKAAKPAIREMARNNLIQDPEKWLGFIESRNDTSRAYDEDVALKVYAQIEFFLPEVTNLVETLENKNNEIWFVRTAISFVETVTKEKIEI